jgi:hypothetical protein
MLRTCALLMGMCDMALPESWLRGFSFNNCIGSK